MPRNWTRIAALALAGMIMTALSARAGDPTASLKQGTPPTKSAGPLAFGPDGILFVGDTQGRRLFAIDTGDRTAAAQKQAVQLKDLAGRWPGMLGTDGRQVMINDWPSIPLSGNVYLSVARRRGPDATPVIVRIDRRRQARRGGAGQRPVRQGRDPQSARTRRQDRAASALRNESITDLAYVDGRVFLAGLSNEEFSSRLIAIPFPSAEGFDGAAIEIYHGAHGQFETKSPVRTFVAYRISNEPYLLAAYTCTPLVKVPVADLKAGAHVKGTTIAELGNRNRPLDMIVYRRTARTISCWPTAAGAS